MVRIRFILRGSAGRKELAGRVVAFSKKLNTLELVSSVVIVLLLRGYYLPLFGQLYPSYSAASLSPALLTGVALYLLVTLLNYVAIRRKVMSVWHLHEH